MNNMASSNAVFVLFAIEQAKRKKVTDFLSAFEVLQLDPFKTYPKEFILKRLELVNEVYAERYVNASIAKVLRRKILKQYKTKDEKKAFKEALKKEYKEVKKIKEYLIFAEGMFNQIDEDKFTKKYKDVFKELKKLKFTINPSTVKDEWTEVDKYDINAKNYLKIKNKQDKKALLIALIITAIIILLFVVIIKIIIDW